MKLIWLLYFFLIGLNSCISISQYQNTKKSVTSHSKLNSDRNRNVLLLENFASLSESQLNQLNSLSLRSDAGDIIPIYPILPQSLPSNYKVRKIEIHKRDKPSIDDDLWYRVTYENSQDQCFTITARLPQGAGPAEHKVINDIQNEVLGNLSLGYTDFDQYFKGSIVELAFIVGFQKSYSFQGMSLAFIDYHMISPSLDNEGKVICRCMDLKDAIEVTKSLRYILDKNEDSIGLTVKNGMSTR